MKKSAVLVASLAFVACAYSGTCTKKFLWYRNAAVENLTVPLILEEGVDGFTYTGFVSSDGSDLRISVDGGVTTLPYEIDVWDAQGKSVVWVLVPEFSRNTTLTLSWGDEDAAASDGDPWDGAELVMHLTEGQHMRRDSSALPADFTANPDSGTPGTAEGVVGSSGSFGDRNRRLYAPSFPPRKFDSIENAFTITFWLRRRTMVGAKDNEYILVAMPKNSKGQTNNQFAVVYGHTVVDAVGLFFYNVSDEKYTEFSGFENNSATIRAPEDMKWHHYAYTYDGTTLTGYLDGHVKFTYKVELAFNPDMTQYGGNIKIGGATGGNWCRGYLDEIRMEGVCRGADWVRAQCETQAQTIPGCGQVVCRFPEAPPSPGVTDFPAYVRIDRRMHGHTRDLIKRLAERTASVCDGETGEPLEYVTEEILTNDVGSVSLWIRMPEFHSGKTVRIADSSAVQYYVPEAEDVPDVGSGVFGGEYYHLWHFALGDGRFHLDSGAQDIKFWSFLSVNNANDFSGEFYAPPVDGPKGPRSAVHMGAVTGSTTNRTCISNTFDVSEPLTNVYTVSWWMRKDDVADPADQTYLFVYTGNKESVGKANQSAFYFTGNTLKQFGGTGTASSLLTVADTEWHHYAVVCDGADIKVYRDGAVVNEIEKSWSFAIFPASSGTPYRIGVGITPSGARPLDGALSEFRIETVARDATWIKALYDNQSKWSNAPALYGSKTEADENSIVWSVRHSSRWPSKTVLYYGTADSGERKEGWEGSLEVDVSDDGEVSAVLEGLPSDTGRVARFRSENAYGVVWSDAIVARTRISTEDRLCRRIPVNVNYTGGETLKGLPLAIRLPSSESLPSVSHALRVFTADGEELPFDVETWNPSGESVIWTRLPILASETNLVVRWRNFDASSAPWPSSAVWSDGYLRVYHLSETFSPDVSRYGADIVSNTIATVGTGCIGGSFAYDGEAAAGDVVETEISAESLSRFSRGFTLSLWVKIPDDLNAETCYIAANNGRSYGDQRFSEVIYNFGSIDSALRLRVPELCQDDYFAKKLAETVRQLALERPDDGWHQYVWTHDGEWFSCYLDGQFVDRRICPGLVGGAFLETQRGRVRLGCTQENKTPFKGGIDEYRVSDRARSAAWIKASYDNIAGNLVTTRPVQLPPFVFILR